MCNSRTIYIVEKMSIYSSMVFLYGRQIPIKETLPFLMVWGFFFPSDSVLHLSHQSQCAGVDFNSEVLKCTASFPGIRQSLLLDGARPKVMGRAEGRVFFSVDALPRESCGHSHKEKASGPLQVCWQGCPLAPTLRLLLLQHPAPRSLLVSQHYGSGEENTQN